MNNVQAAKILTEDIRKKMEQKKYTKEYFSDKIFEHNWMLQRLCEHIVLRPNDNKRCFGEKGFANFTNPQASQWD